MKIPDTEAAYTIVAGGGVVALFNDINWVGVLTVAVLVVRLLMDVPKVINYYRNKKKP